MLWIVFLWIPTGYSSKLPKNETELGETNSTVNYPSGQDVVIQTLKEIASRIRWIAGDVSDRCRHFQPKVLKMRFSFPESEWMYRYALAFNHFGRDGMGIWNLKSDILRSRVFKRKRRSIVLRENKLCDDFFVNLERGCDIIGQDDSTFEELMELVKANPCASGRFQWLRCCLQWRDSYLMDHFQRFRFCDISEIC